MALTFPESEYRKRVADRFRQRADEILAEFEAPPAPPQAPDPAMTRFREHSAFNQTMTPPSPPPAPPVGPPLVPAASPEGPSSFNQRFGGHPVAEEPVAPPLGPGFGQAQEWGRRQQVGPPAPAFPRSSPEPPPPDFNGAWQRTLATPSPIPGVTLGEALDYAQRPQQGLFGGWVAAREARAAGAVQPDIFNQGIAATWQGLSGERRTEDTEFLTKGLGIDTGDPTKNAALGFAAGMVFDPANVLGPGGKAGKVAKAITSIRRVDPKTLIFRESDQINLPAVREAFPKKDYLPATVIQEPDRSLTILDGHHRAVVAAERGHKLPVVGVTRAEYDALRQQGFDDIEIAYAALDRAKADAALDALNAQFPGAQVAERGAAAGDALDMLTTPVAKSAGQLARPGSRSGLETPTAPAQEAARLPESVTPPESALVAAPEFRPGVPSVAEPEVAARAAPESNVVDAPTIAVQARAISRTGTPTDLNALGQLTDSVDAYQLPLSQWLHQTIGSTRDPDAFLPIAHLHRASVARALAEGKPVPRPVLEEYAERLPTAKFQLLRDEMNTVRQQIQQMTENVPNLRDYGWERVKDFEAAVQKHQEEVGRLQRLLAAIGKQRNAIREQIQQLPKAETQAVEAVEPMRTPAVEAAPVPATTQEPVRPTVVVQRGRSGAVRSQPPPEPSPPASLVPEVPPKAADDLPAPGEPVTGLTSTPTEVTGLRGGLGALGAGLTDSMYDMLWEQMQKGSVTEAGQTSVFLQVAKSLYDQGKLTRAELPQLGAAVQQVRDAGLTGAEYQTALRHVINNWQSVGSPSSAPARGALLAPRPRQSAPPVPPPEAPPVPPPTTPAAPVTAPNQAGITRLPPPPPPPPPTSAAGGGPGQPKGKAFVRTTPPVAEQFLPRMPSNKAVLADIEASAPTNRLAELASKTPGAKALSPAFAAQDLVDRLVLIRPKLRVFSQNLETQASAFLDEMGKPWKGLIDDEGRFTRDVTPKSPGGSLAWVDVAENPHAYNMPEPLRQWFQRAWSLNDDLTDWAVNGERIKLHIREYGPNQHYMPRIVKEIRGAELRLRNDPNQARTAGTMEEHLQRGVVYSTDPRESLLIHWRTLLGKVEQQRMLELLKPLGKTRTQLLDPTLTEAVRTAAGERTVVMKFEDALRSVRAGGSLYTAIPTPQGPRRVLRTEITRIEHVKPGTVERLLELLRPKGKGLPMGEVTPEILATHAQYAGKEHQAERRAMRGLLRDTAAKHQLDEFLLEVEQWRKEAGTVYDKAKTARRQALEKLPASAEAAQYAGIYQQLGLPTPKGDAITVAPIHARAAGGRYFPARVADAFNEVLGTQQQHKTLQALSTASGWAKTFALGLDAGVGMYHLLPVLATNPRAWGKALSALHGATIDTMVGGGTRYPTYLAQPEQQRLMQKYAKDVTWESLEYVQSAGDIVGATQRVPLIGPAVASGVKGAEAGFTAAINVAKLELLKALDPLATTPERTRQIATAVNDMTGTLSLRAAGIGQAQRDAEGILFTSSRFMRSGLLFSANAFKPGIEGTLARNVLAVETAVFPLVMYSAARILGQDPKPEEFFNPASDHYLEVELFGKRVPLFGGFHLALVRTLARASADALQGKAGEAALEVAKFPLNRLGPLPSLLRDFGPALWRNTPRDFRGEPLDTPKEVAERLGKVAIPLWLQDPIFPEPGAAPSSVGSTALEFYGGRVMDYTESMQRDRAEDALAQQRFGRSWDDLDLDEEAQLKRDPNLARLIRQAREARARRGDVNAEFWLAVDDYRQQKRQQIAALTDDFKARKLPSRQYRQQVSALERDSALYPEELKKAAEYRAVPLTDEEMAQAYPNYQPKPRPVRDFVNAWYQLSDQATDPRTGTADLDQLFLLREQLVAQTPPEIVERAKRDVFSQYRDPEYARATEEYREWQQLAEQSGLSLAELHAASRFAQQVSDTRQQAGGRVDRQRVVALVAQQNPEGAMAYQKRERLRQTGVLQRVTALRSQYFQAHPRLQQWFSDGVLAPAGSSTP